MHTNKLCNEYRGSIQINRLGLLGMIFEAKIKCFLTTYSIFKVGFWTDYLARISTNVFVTDRITTLQN